MSQGFEKALKQGAAAVFRFIDERTKRMTPPPLPKSK